MVAQIMVVRVLARDSTMRSDYIPCPFVSSLDFTQNHDSRHRGSGTSETWRNRRKSEGAAAESALLCAVVLRYAL